MVPHGRRRLLRPPMHVEGTELGFVYEQPPRLLLCAEVARLPQMRRAQYLLGFFQEISWVLRGVHNCVFLKAFGREDVSMEVRSSRGREPLFFSG